MTSTLLKDLAIRMQVVRQAQQVFFEAMQEGYIDKTSSKIEIPQLVGSKHIIFAPGDEWIVTDTYIVSSEGDGSGGTTVISYDGVPIWMMQYGGHYPKNAITFLKEALAINYSSETWEGGRGPRHFEKDGWTYVNSPVANKFGEFFGHDCVFGPDKMMAGTHRYHGFWLIRP